jgi:hypothetical protein
MGPLLLLIAPSLYSDRVVIDDEHFEARYGFWFAPSVHDVRFDDLRAVQHATVTNDRGRKNRELHCLHKSGAMTVIPCGDLVRNTVPEILDRAKARGVAVVE